MKHHHMAIRLPERINGYFICLFLFISILSNPKSLFSFSSSDDFYLTTVVIATADSSAESKKSANFIGDGIGDQKEINAAIKSLPKVGGTIHLMEGTYDIRKVKNSLGGIIIERSNVLFKGQGTSTKLILASKQNTNVIRIIGSNIGFITIQDLYIDANRQQNNEGKGDPNVSHARFEFCGIKAFYTFPGGPTGIRNHHITVKNCHVLNSQRLGIMLEGSHMKVINNTLGNAGSDVVEILTGPGEIRGNYCEITEQTHVAIGSDRADSIMMSDNIIHVKEKGKLDIGFRSWSNSHQHIISNNIIKIDKGGICKIAMDIRGFESTISGNNIRNHQENKPIHLKIKAGNALITGNYFENLVIDINDQTGTYQPIISNNNLMNHSQVSHIKGLFNDKKK